MGGGEYQRQRLLGKKIKKYNLVEKLGSGSYGTVYKAVNTKNDQILAIKAMSKKQMKQIPKLEQLVKSQIQILQDVKSQNVIKFIDSFSSGDCVFIVTQFCNGGDLQQYCKKQGKIPQIEAVNFLKQILNGFKGLHEINTMHRDFKLANVLLHNHVCKIADLGFAKQVKQKALTVTQLGTDQTMAPQVHQGQKYGWGADIWSIGVVFYQMIYGKLPYAGVNDYAILRNIKTTTPKYDGVDVSQQTIDFIQKCLVYEPSKRITWKQIYNHPILYKSDIALTTGLLRSRINFDGHKKYYDKNQEEKRKTVNLSDEFDIFNWNLGGTTKKDKDIFQNAGEMKNADYKADKIRKNKQELEKQFQNLQTLIIQQRNNKMFGITQVLPLQRSFSNIDISHSKALYQICKYSFIEMKNLRKQIQQNNKSYQGHVFWKQFKQQDIYKNISDQLLDDQMFAQSLALSYKPNHMSENENINRPTDKRYIQQTIRNYRKQLTPFLKKQNKKTKLKFIKMIYALKAIEQSPLCDYVKFNEKTQNLKVQTEEKKLLNEI